MEGFLKQRFNLALACLAHRFVAMLIAFGLFHRLFIDTIKIMN